jgi:hypothetical protein
MRAPLPSSHSVTQDELVSAIAGRLKPWLDCWTRDDIVTDINEQINLLKKTAPDFFARQAVTQTRDNARNVFATVTRLEEKISAELRLRLAGSFADIKRECKAAISGSLTRGRGDQVKEWCALSAWRWIVKFSQARPTSGSINSPYREIASLVYEAVTGNQDKDFERTCEAVLKRRRHLVQNGS